MDLIPDQYVDAITLREAFYLVVFVPPDPLGKVRGNAGVQGSIAFAGHDIYARLVQVLIPHHIVLCQISLLTFYLIDWIAAKTLPQ